MEKFLKKDTKEAMEDNDKRIDQLEAVIQKLNSPEYEGRYDSIVAKLNRELYPRKHNQYYYRRVLEDNTLALTMMIVPEVNIDDLIREASR